MDQDNKQVRTNTHTHTHRHRGKKTIEGRYSNYITICSQLVLFDCDSHLNKKPPESLKTQKGRLLLKVDLQFFFLYSGALTYESFQYQACN